MNDQPQNLSSGKQPQRRPVTERNLPRVGNIISWETMGGQHYRGKVIEMDGNVAHVILKDGTRKAVEC
jgi:hypothetical protein